MERELLAPRIEREVIYLKKVKVHQGKGQFGSGRDQHCGLLYKDDVGEYAHEAHAGAV